ncbi:MULTISPECIES: hypothetical protein [unclassified Pseudoalteromonas]|uniref:hypothetical protein n=1 Tax=unclassified Pseudoalteromonas TaxID=194690 RepID=UPI001F3B3F9A|nr:MULTISPECIES: hypothetical protein [unclassified Pseudoalteromonas]MCF2829373.1 hypothetical protein [Pseudoalteromonas sp. OF5H-5]MCF2927096.1 hypothetical protein [Pseudoalteromonas sp. DL2-H1]
MARPRRQSSKKTRKEDFEGKLEQVVGEYRQAKEVLDALAEDTVEYSEQKDECDKLFARAERFINRLS